MFNSRDGISDTIIHPKSSTESSIEYALLVNRLQHDGQSGGVKKIKSSEVQKIRNGFDEIIKQIKNIMSGYGVSTSKKANINNKKIEWIISEALELHNSVLNIYEYNKMLFNQMCLSKSAIYGLVADTFREACDFVQAEKYYLKSLEETEVYLDPSLQVYLTQEEKNFFDMWREEQERERVFTLLQLVDLYQHKLGRVEDALAFAEEINRYRPNNMNRRIQNIKSELHKRLQSLPKSMQKRYMNLVPVNRTVIQKSQESNKIKEIEKNHLNLVK